ncbi:MAG: septum site-determining protein MinD [Clostridiales Family XIII bacterium]|jgi:septum site-determining protein MinD|nr:septum site-determining protein MinD [Clostridiales Family XIII bacterium]
MGRVVLIASGKGGVGKSVCVSNLGAVYGERGLKVALVDMNIGLRNLDIYMGLESRVIFDAADVLDGVVTAKKAMVRDRRFQALYLLATTQKKEKFRADAKDVSALYGYLRENFDIVLVDGPAGINDELKLAATDADVAIMVTTPEYVSLRDADMAEQTLRKSGIRDRVYIVNKVNKVFFSSGILPTVEIITSMMKIPLLGVVQYDDNIHLSANCGIPIVYQKENYIERNFNRIADRLLTY